MPHFTTQPLIPGLADVCARFVRSRMDRTRAACAALPREFNGEESLQARIDASARAGQAVGAFDGDRLVGFLRWSRYDAFRGTGQAGAWVDVNDHGLAEGTSETLVYGDLYAAAAERWTATGCQVHGIAIYPSERELMNLLTWNGFALAVIDGCCRLDDIGREGSAGGAFEVGRAQLSDLPAVERLDRELVQYLHAPPVLMPLHHPRSAVAQAEFIKRDGCRLWLAIAGGEPVGMLRIEPRGHGATEVVGSDDGAAITGAYVAPAWRGQGVASALLARAADDCRSRGLTRLSVDYESFNPLATAFWGPRFPTVCLSLLRRPERFI